VSAILSFVLCTLSFVIVSWLASFRPGGAVAEGMQSSKHQVQSTPQGNSKSPLLEVGVASKLRSVNDSPAEVKVVSYNIRWRGGDDLRRLAQLMKDDAEIGGAAILGLQEVDRNKKRTGNTNTVKFLADELGMYYAWAAPPSPTTDSKEEETGVAILSSYPLSQVHRIVLPHEGPGRRRRVALGATVTLGKTSLRIYSVHCETRIPVDKKIEQMKAVMDDLNQFPKGTSSVVMGDFNTWEREAVEKTSKLFTDANFLTPFDEQPTFFQRILIVSVDLKLDWMWLRNLESSTYGVNRRIELSDHCPLWVVLKTKTAN
jgi:endonuclease/exonuclease/phosphatase family metal-dependent hydrolase